MDTDILRQRLDLDNKTLRRLLLSLRTAYFSAGSSTPDHPIQTPSSQQRLACIKELQNLADSVKKSALQHAQATNELALIQSTEASISEQVEQVQQEIALLQASVTEAIHKAALSREYDGIAKEILAFPDPEKSEERITGLKADIEALQQESSSLDASMDGSKRTIMTMYHIMDNVKTALKDGVSVTSTFGGLEENVTAPSPDPAAVNEETAEHGEILEDVPEDREDGEEADDDEEEGMIVDSA